MTGRLGITQIVDGERWVLVMPAPLIGGPGPITAEGLVQHASGWGDDIDRLIARWAEDVETGRQAVALAQAEARELEALYEIAGQLQDDPRNLEILREIMRRLGAGDDAVSVAVANALIDARDETGALAESAADFTTRAANELKALAETVTDVAQTLLNVTLFMGVAWGASRLIRAART